MPPGVDSTQQRRARASCDLCRRMKIRCDRSGDKCSACLARSVPCHITITESRKPRVKKNDHFNSIESRIKRMESLLQSSGIVVERSPAPPKTEISSSETIAEQTTPTALDDLSNLVINEVGQQKFLGSSSGFSLLSPRGVAWVRGKTRSSLLDDNLKKLQNQCAQIWPQFSIDHYWPRANYTRHMLPSPSVARQIVTRYFCSFNVVFPIYDEKTFYSHLDRQYSDDPLTSKSWYAVFNIVLAIGCIIGSEGMNLESPTMDGPSTREGLVELGWRFFQNAASVFNDLLFSENDLMAVQATLGMAFVMEATINPEASYVLIGIAVRMAHGMGLHRNLSGFGLSQAELLQRRYVFWSVYVFEKSLCLRVGRPSSILDDDIAIPLPSQDRDTIKSLVLECPSTPARGFYAFRAMCNITLIESRVYSELYSARSWTKAPEERLDRVSRLDRELEEWKDSIPIEVRPEHSIQCSSEHRFIMMMMHFVYYNCLTAIHRVSIHHGSWTTRDAEENSPPSHSSPSSSAGVTPVNPRVYSSYALCLSAARSTVHLTNRFLTYDDDPRKSLIWVAVYFPLAACLTLFGHAIQTPSDPHVDSDLALVDCTLCRLNRPLNMDGGFNTCVTLDIFQSLVSIAREYVQNTRDGQESANFQSSSSFPTSTAPPSNQQIAYNSSESAFPGMSPFTSSLQTPSQPPLQPTPSTTNNQPMNNASKTPPPSHTSLNFSSYAGAFNMLGLDFMDNADLSFLYNSDWRNYDFDTAGEFPNYEEDQGP